MILLFLIFQIFTYTAGRFDLPWKEHVQDLMNTVHPELVTGYVGYFVLGHYLYEYGLPKKIERMVCILGPVMILAGIWLCRQESLASGKATQAFYENYTIFACIWSTAVFLFFKEYVSKIQWSERMEKMICSLGGCTFGIYLIHAFVRDVLYRNGIDSMMMRDTILAIPFVMGLIFLISWGIVFIAEKVPFIKKWIM